MKQIKIKFSDELGRYVVHISFDDLLANLVDVVARVCQNYNPDAWKEHADYLSAVCRRVPAGIQSLFEDGYGPYVIPSVLEDEENLHDQDIEVWIVEEYGSVRGMIAIAPQYFVM